LLAAATRSLVASVAQAFIISKNVAAQVHNGGRWGTGAVATKRVRQLSGRWSYGATTAYLKWSAAKLAIAAIIDPNAEVAAAINVANKYRWFRTSYRRCISALSSVPRRSPTVNDRSFSISFLSGHSLKFPNSRSLIGLFQRG
jgi:hypothetical protein